MFLVVCRNPYLEPVDDDTSNCPDPINDALKSSQSRRYLKSFIQNDDENDYSD